jgi:hypothetical protein
MNASILATSVAPDRDAAAFDLSIGSEEPSTPTTPSSTASAATGAINGGINYPAAASRRGLLGMVKGMVARRLDTSQGTVASDSGKEVSTHVNNKNYAARWRVTKLVVFDMVRNGLPVTATATTATAASVTSTGSGNALYRLSRRRGTRKSVIGDKVRKLQALQRGVVRKIGWLPEWWWDLLPVIDCSSELSAHVGGSLAELVDHGAEGEDCDDPEADRAMSESTLLDEAEDPFERDQQRRVGARSGGCDPWQWLQPWEGCDWLVRDMVSTAECCDFASVILACRCWFSSRLQTLFSQPVSLTHRTLWRLR